MKKRMMYYLFALAFTLLLSSNVQSKPTDLQSVKIASAAHIVNFLPLDVAVAKGFFEDEGLKPEIIYLRGGTLCAQALISKQVDFSINSISHALKAAAQGNENLRMICLFNKTPGALIVVDSQYKDKVKTVADLKGMRLGVTSHGSISHMILAFLLAKSNVSLDDVEIIKTGTSTFPAALKNGNVDAGITGEPLASMMVEQGDAFVLKRLISAQETEDTFGGPYSLLGLMTRQDLIGSDPELVQKVVNVHLRAMQWINEHSAEEITEALPSDFVGSDPGTYVKTLKLMKAFLSVDGSLSRQGAENVLSSMRISGVFDSTASFNVGDFLNETFLNPTPAVRPTHEPPQPNNRATEEPPQSKIWVYLSVLLALVLLVSLIMLRRRSE
ncbi:MAG: ABC transporter substrate-binding protein [Desulfobulbaceae bacterium]|nr:ABC transporter substrate-binding protein [Desulfobulbaceae bacterium]